MATLTTAQGYPYPASSETPDVPRDLAALANFLQANCRVLRIPTVSAAATASVSAITTEQTILTAPAITGNGSTAVHVHAYLPALNASAAGDVYEIRLKMDASTVQTAVWKPATTGAQTSMHLDHVVVPAAGSHTFTLTMVRTSGSGNAQVVMGATQSGQIFVEQMWA